MIKKFLAASALLSSCLCVQAKELIKLASSPNISPDNKTIVFDWKGDLWSAPITGGEVKRLTTHPAWDHRPIFSPDGKEICFVSNRNNTWQIYAMPVTGGVAEKLTFHTEGYTPTSWSAGGKSIIAQVWRAYSGLESQRFCKVSRDGSKDDELLFDAYAREVSLSADGKFALLTREDVSVYRKGYTGSKTGQIWLYDMTCKKFTQLIAETHNSRSPLWKVDGRGFYYLSEKNGCFNIWEFDLATKKEKQLTFFKNASIITPSISLDGSTITFRQLFDYYYFKPASGKPPQLIEVWHTSDQPPKKTKKEVYNKVWNNDNYGGLEFTKDGLEMVFSMGGELWVMDTVMRKPVRVTNDSSYHVRDVIFSKDDKIIYYLKDEGHKVNIWKAERENSKEYWWLNKSFKLTPVTNDEIGRYNLSLSPNGKQLAYCQGRGDIVICNIDGSNPKQISHSPYQSYYSWAPDGKWMVVTRQDSDSNTDVWITSTTGERAPYNLSRHPNWDGHASWSPDGKRIAYIGRRYDGAVDVYYAELIKGLKPTQASGEEKELAKAIAKMERSRGKRKTEEKKEEKKEVKKEKPKKKIAKTKDGLPIVVIDFDDLYERVFKLPESGSGPWGPFWNPEGDTLAFATRLGGKSGTFTVSFPNPGRPSHMTSKTGHYANWITKGNKLLWMVNGIPTSYNTSLPFRAYVESNQEDYYKLAFRSCWRTMRDNFYDGNMNNLDWNAIRLKYEDIAAKGASDPQIFGRAISMMLGELNASHLGWTNSSRSNWKSDDWAERTRYLGLDFDSTISGKGLKVSKILLDGPTDKVATKVNIGDTLIELNGKKVNSQRTLIKLLTVRDNPVFTLKLMNEAGDERLVKVKAIAFNTARNLVREEWLKYNRKMVEKLSKNRLGYLNIEAMDTPSLRRFEQEICAGGQDKGGMIIDVRNNPGGFIADQLLKILSHPHYAVTIPRDGKKSYPSGYLQAASWRKPIIVLCNQNSASNAEIFSHLIKESGRGKLVGIATQGAVISTPQRKILDVGEMRMPDRGWWTISDGEDMELHGAQPDYVIWPYPGDIPAGKDTQLEKAIEVLLQEVEEAKKLKPAKLIKASDRHLLNDQK